jgi:hypothetical protein
MIPGRIWGFIWIAIGVAITTLEFGLGFGPFELFGIPMPVGLLAVLYGGIVVAYHQRRTRALELSEGELRQHGPTLERVAPMIVDLLKRKVRVKEIGEILERQEKLPREVTYKYIIALGNKMSEQAAEESEEVSAEP